jgi:tetratricopeptide (TPR) repeat protein
MFTLRNYRLYIFTLLSFVLLGLNASYAQDNLSEGIKAVKQGEYLKAVDLLKKAVSGDDKDSYDANYYYGVALFNTGSLADAEKYLKKAVNIDDERPEAYAVIGEVYSEQKKFGDAASYFEKSKKYLPLNKRTEDLEKDEIALIVEVLSKEAENYIADGKVDKAITSLTQAKVFDNKNPQIYVGLGDAYLNRGALEPALTNYNEALKYKANYAPAIFGLGKVSFKKKKYNDAIEFYSKAIDADKNYADAYFEKGLILYLSDQFPAALDMFKKYAELRPGSTRGNT